MVSALETNPLLSLLSPPTPLKSTCKQICRSLRQTSLGEGARAPLKPFFRPFEWTAAAVAAEGNKHPLSLAGEMPSALDRPAAVMMLSLPLSLCLAQNLYFVFKGGSRGCSNIAILLAIIRTIEYIHLICGENSVTALSTL